MNRFFCNLFRSFLTTKPGLLKNRNLPFFYLSILYIFGMLKNSTRPAPRIPRRGFSLLPRDIAANGDCALAFGRWRPFIRRPSIHIRLRKLESSAMTFTCWAFPAMPVSDTRVISAKFYRFSARCHMFRHHSPWHEVRCSSLRQTGSGRSRSVSTALRSSVESLPLFALPCSKSDGALFLSTFSRLSDLLPYSSQYRCRTVQFFVTTAQRR